MPDLEDGETIEIQGSAKAPYVIKNVGGVYSCTCPAWRNQSLPIERRTCKHIRKLRGDAAEEERTGGALPARKASPAKAEGPPLLLAHAWQNDVDLTGWWMSEKLDGVRAYWDGRRFLSRQGNVFHAPDWFTAGLPETPFDGELWLERRAFQRTVSIVRRQDKSDHWKQVRYVVFDAPALKEPFEARLEYVQDNLRHVGSEFVLPLEHERCRNLGHLRDELERIGALGGEGLMMREPGSLYEAGRSTTLLKVKQFHEDDAVVVDHLAGKGRHKGRLGALLLRLRDGTEFSVGTGLSDKQRERPPAVGSTVTFRYQELSEGGVPRFPSFVRLRTDVPSAPLADAAAADESFSPSPSPSSSVRRPSQAAGSALEGRPAFPSKKKGRKMSSSGSAPAEPSGGRYFEYVQGKSSKFWEIAVEGTDVTVRFGRIGAKGQTKTKSFADESSARAHAEKLIEQKTGKGYQEKER